MSSAGTQFDDGWNAFSSRPRSQRMAELLPVKNEMPRFKNEAEEKLFLCDRLKKRTELLTLEERIIQMKKELETALSHRSALIRDLEDYKVLFDPVRRTPVELLQEIFSLAKTHVVEDVFHPTSSFDLRRPPWVFTQVCRRWREVAVSFPSLWSDVSIVLKREHVTDVKRCQGLMFLLGTQLSRSAMNPLRIHFTCQVSIPPVHAILPLLVMSAPRWRSLSISIVRDNLRSLLPIRESLSSLHDLAVAFNQLPNASLTIDLADDGLGLFELASQLRHINLRSPTARHLRLPWDSISMIETYQPEDGFGIRHTTAWHSEVLQKASKISSFSVFLSIESNPAWISVTHMHLRILNLTASPSTYYHHGDPVILLNTLTLPVLEILRITSYAVTFDADAVLAMVLRSRCKLKTLSVIADGASIPSCTPLLLSLDHLQTLTFNFLNGTSYDLLYLDMISAPDTMLPRLKSFTILGVTITNDDVLDALRAARTQLHIDVFAFRTDSESLLTGEMSNA